MTYKHETSLFWWVKWALSTVVHVYVAVLDMHNMYTHDKGVRRMQMVLFKAFLVLNMMWTKILQNIHFSTELFCPCMIALMYVDVHCGTNPSACLQNNFQFHFCLCPVTCSVVVWHLSASADMFNANLGSFCPFKECVEPKYEVLGEDSLRPASMSIKPVKSKI